MIDSNVLSYLVADEPDPTTDPKHHAEWLASRELIARIQTVRVSSLSWFEVYRFRPDPVNQPNLLFGERLTEIAKHVIVEAFDVAAAERGAKLFALCRPKVELCIRCYSSTSGKVCTKCNRSIALHVKLIDSMIVAQADQMDGLTHLYTFDGGMLEMGSLVRTSLTVVEPPAATGIAVTRRRGRFVTPDTPDIGDSMATPVAVIDDLSEMLSDDLLDDEA